MNTIEGNYNKTLAPLETNLMSITFRQEEADDITEIATVIKSAFLTHQYSNHTEQYIINALRDSGELTISLVAVKNKVIVGHIAFSPVTISDSFGDWFSVGPKLPKHFLNLDEKFHYYSGMLAHVFAKKKPVLISFYFSKMSETCVSCHSLYATKKFPSFKSRAKESKLHH